MGTLWNTSASRRKLAFGSGTMGRGDEVNGVLHYGGVLALIDELQRGLAAGLAAAEDDDLVAHGLLLAQQLGERHALAEAGDGHLARHGAGGDDDLVKAAPACRRR